MSVRGMERAFLCRNGHAAGTSFESCFPFLDEHGHVISLVGGGGKTTLMHALADAYRQRGMKAAVMTTTRMMKPACAVRTIEACRKLWTAEEYAVCGEDAPQGKLSAPQEDVIRALLAEADALLIEADGAKRMACKAPAAHEPVILPETDIVIGVVGVEVLGRRVSEACFRPERVCEALGCDMEHRLTAEDLATLLLSQKGLRKGVGERQYYTVINKCDDRERIQNGLAVARALEQRGHSRTVLTSFIQEK